jgi:hypothetical protein
MKAKGSDVQAQGNEANDRFRLIAVICGRSFEHKGSDETKPACGTASSWQIV